MKNTLRSGIATPVLALFGSLAAALSGCGSSSSGTNGTTTGNLDAGADTAACTSYATATCGLYASCSNNWYIALEYGDSATCIARTTASCVRRLELPDSARTITQIEGCSSAVSAASCEALYGDQIPACNAPAGPESAGTGCAAAAQCASAYCGLPTGAICSSCMTAPVQGDSCATYPCGPGLHCLDTVQTCAPLVSDGGACNDDSDCEFGLACLTKGLFCAPTAGSGDTCDYSAKVGPGCNSRLGLACFHEGDGGLCERHSLADAGQPCGKVSDGGVAADCVASGFCQKAADAGTGICLAAAADGTACDSNVGPNCLPPARCVPSPTGDGFAGTCEEPYSPGCQSGSNTDGGTDGGDTGEFLASGTFVGTADAGAVNANLTGFQSSLAEFLAVSSGYQLSIAAFNGDGTSTATFSSPANITSYNFTSSIVFPNAPVVGTISSSASCGNVGMSFGTTAQPFLYNYTAQVAGSNCQGQVGSAGSSWTLTFSSVSAPGGDLGNFYTAHGTLQSTMPDGNGNSSTLNLSF